VRVRSSHHAYFDHHACYLFKLLDTILAWATRRHLGGYGESYLRIGPVWCRLV